MSKDFEQVLFGALFVILFVSIMIVQITSAFKIRDLEQELEMLKKILEIKELI